MSAVEAQLTKRDIYRTISSSYGKEAAAEKTAQKAQAFGLKEEIVRAAPQAEGINKMYSGLVKTQDFIESHFKGKLSGAIETAAGIVGGGLTGGLTVLLGKPLIGMALLKGLQQRIAGESVGIFDKVFLPLLQRGSLSALTSEKQPGNSSRPPIESFFYKK